MIESKDDGSSRKTFDLAGCPSVGWSIPKPNTVASSQLFSGRSSCRNRRVDRRGRYGPGRRATRRLRVGFFPINDTDADFVNHTGHFVAGCEWIDQAGPKVVFRE